MSGTELNYWDELWNFVEMILWLFGFLNEDEPWFCGYSSGGDKKKPAEAALVFWIVV